MRFDNATVSIRFELARSQILGADDAEAKVVPPPRPPERTAPVTAAAPAAPMIAILRSRDLVIAAPYGHSWFEFSDDEHSDP
jgi:hypothetical protein